MYLTLKICDMENTETIFVTVAIRLPHMHR